MSAPFRTASPYSTSCRKKILLPLPISAEMFIFVALQQIKCIDMETVEDV